jgi:hypothetical protein
MKLYRKQIILSAAIALMAGVVQANEVCNTVSECQKLRWRADARIQQLESGISSIGDFLRNRDGSVKTGVNQYQADALCKAQGKRLPTLRELAVEANKHGAEMLELNQVSSGKPPTGFHLVSVRNADGKRDHFYYSTGNYARPRYSGDHWTWSSSLSPTHYDSAYHLLNYGGYISNDNRDHRDNFSAVRCVSSAGVVQANEVCNNLSECQKLRWRAVARIPQLQSGYSSIGKFLRNTDGTVKTRIDQYEAYVLCQAQGKRLATARELAVEATKHGAEILELNQVSSGKPPEGFYLVSAVNADGKKDHFYYSSENYARPQSDLGKHWIWSSSEGRDKYGVFHYVLHSWEGHLAFARNRDNRDNSRAAVCVSSAGVNR